MKNVSYDEISMFMVTTSIFKVTKSLEMENVFDFIKKVLGIIR